MYLPSSAEQGRAPDRGIGIGADPDRWRRLLQGLHCAVGVFEHEMRARHIDEILGPQPLYGEQAFLEALRRLFPRHAKGLEFDVAVADAAAEYQFAAAHDVQCRQLLGDVERLVTP